jgi:hypothetical protein
MLKIIAGSGSQENVAISPKQACVLNPNADGEEGASLRVGAGQHGKNNLHRAHASEQSVRAAAMSNLTNLNSHRDAGA